MNKRLIHFLFVALLLTACAPTDNSVQPVDRTPDVPSFLLPVERVVIHSASYTITVRNPTRALAELQKAVEAAGGYVGSASSWSNEGSGSYASLSAKVPPEAFPALGEAVNRIADTVQSQNAYTQDVTAEVRQLQQRYHDLTLAQEQLLLVLVNARDLDSFSTYGTLRELLDHELREVENQLESYEQQARLGSFDVTINQPASLFAPIE